MREPGDCTYRVGSEDYYVVRHYDFIARHATLEPPPYYLEYGHKYYRRFQELRGQLSTVGQAWVVHTARKLQQSIEDRRKKDPPAFDALECDRGEFQRFAYDSHPTAYLEAGLDNLPLQDLLRIVNTPDAKDLLTDAGLTQVFRTAIELIRRHDPKRDFEFSRRAVLELSASLRRLGLTETRLLTEEVRQLSDEVLDPFRYSAKAVADLVAEVKKSIEPSWIMRQNWETPLFCSWHLPPEVVRPLVPEELELDLRDGLAWISVVPLEMANVGLVEPHLPPLAPFPEVNLRTYVRHNGVPGVYFLSLECGQGMVDFGANLFFHLPYRLASVSIERDGEWFHCESGRGEAAQLSCRYRPLGTPMLAEPGSIEQFLTERYSMFVVEPVTRLVYRGDVHHPPWKVQQAEVEMKVNTLTPALGLPIQGPPDHVGFSPGVETRTSPFVVAS